MDSTQYSIFKSEVERQIRITFRDLINDSEAAERAAIAKHLKLSGALESENIVTKEGQQSTEFSSNPIDYRVALPKTYNKRALTKYAILSWFLPEFTSWELRETITARAHEKHFWEIGCYTYSFECCMSALFGEVDLSHSDLFGNLLKSKTSPVRAPIAKVIGEETNRDKVIKNQVTDFCRLWLDIPAKAQPKVFRRGYNDHGSGRPNHKSGLGRFNEDIELEILQERIELRRAQFSLLWRTRIHQVLNKGYT